MPTAIARITRWCHHCDEGLDVPNKGLGRAFAASWATQHQGHVIGTSPTDLPDDTPWKWTCEACGATDQDTDVLALDRRFSIHSATHVSNVFDASPRAIMEPVTETAGPS